MQPLEQGGELLAFACGQRRKQAALLLVEDLHGGDLGGAALPIPARSAISAKAANSTTVL